MENNHPYNVKTAKILGLFMATALAVLPGCAGFNHTHIDRNGDGYCDEDGRPMNSSTGGRSHYYGGSSGGYYNGTSQSGTHTTTATSGVSTGTAPKGGIGSHSWGGGG